MSGGGRHGTNVAGIIGAIRNNRKGVAGIAGGNGTATQGVRLYSLNVSSPDGYSTGAHLATGLVQGATRFVGSQNGFGLDVMNVSMAFSPQSLAIFSRHYGLLRNAVKTSWLNAVTLAASRGNEGNAFWGNPLLYPACFPDEWVISVSASGSNGNFKNPTNGDVNANEIYTSSYGNGVDIMAPGTTMLVASTSNATNTAYGRFAGTSAAAPHVAGVAALLRGYYGPTRVSGGRLYTEDVEQVLQKTAADRAAPLPLGSMPAGAPDQAVGYDELSGWGMLDATAALQYLQPRRNIYHVGQIIPAGSVNTYPGTSCTRIATNIPYFLSTSYNGLIAGQYILDVYKISSTFTHYLSGQTNTTILDAWPLQVPSSLADFDNPFSAVFGDGRVRLDSWNSTTATVSGYAYHIKYQRVGTGSSTVTINRYFPYNPYTGSIEFQLSLYTDTPPPPNPCPGCTPQRALEVTVYPNPSTEEVALSYENETSGNVTIDLLDAQGVSHKHIERSNVTVGNQLDRLEIEDEPLGIYTVRVVTPTAVMTKTLVVE